jgi:hypothetical protein
MNIGRLTLDLVTAFWEFLMNGGKTGRAAK